MPFRLLLCVIWCASSAIGCECVYPSVPRAKRQAEVVFRGTVTEVKGGKVIFRVDRVWKGNVSQIFELIDFTGPCPGGDPMTFLPGNDVLVYAGRFHRSDGDNEYFPGACSRTRSSN